MDQGRSGQSIQQREVKALRGPQSEQSAHATPSQAAFANIGALQLQRQHPHPHALAQLQLPQVSSSIPALVGVFLLEHVSLCVGYESFSVCIFGEYIVHGTALYCPLCCRSCTQWNVTLIVTLVSRDFAFVSCAGAGVPSRAVHCSAASFAAVQRCPASPPCLPHA